MTQSPIKWPGAKRWAAARFGPLVLETLERRGGVYFEPFFGGGSMGLYVGAAIAARGGPRPPVTRIIASDVIEPLVDFWRAVKDYPAELAFTVARIGLEYGLDEAGYYAVRAEAPDEPLHRAARFVYLNRLGFNGLWRENAKGAMNVP
jgi:DNA adenine methylase